MILKYELIKRIFQNIGAIPFGKCEITTKDFICDSFKTLSDNKTDECLIYNANLSSSEIKLALTNISDELYLTTIIGNNVYGFWIDINENNVSALIFSENKWLQLSILQILNVLIVFETVTQYGVPWNKLQADSVPAINKILASLIELPVDMESLP